MSLTGSSTQYVNIQFPAGLAVWGVTDKELWDSTASFFFQTTLSAPRLRPTIWALSFLYRLPCPLPTAMPAPYCHAVPTITNSKPLEPKSQITPPSVSCLAQGVLTPQQKSNTLTNAWYSCSLFYREQLLQVFWAGIRAPSPCGSRNNWNKHTVQQELASAFLRCGTVHAVLPRTRSRAAIILGTGCLWSGL